MNYDIIIVILIGDSALYPHLSAEVKMSSKEYKFSEETRKKLSKAHIGEIPWNKGKKLSEEYRKKLSIAHLGKKLKPFTEEHKRRIGLANKGKKRSEEDIERNRRTHLGKKLSEETKRKMKLSALRGKESNLWKGGKYKSAQGYLYILKPNHPYSTKMGYVLESRLIMEKNLNRYLKLKEIIHHIDGNIDNNNIKNLMLFENQREHMEYHQKLLKEQIT